MCRSCQNIYVRAHYQANRASYIQKARIRNLEQTRINNAFLVEYLSCHPCVDSDEGDIVVLEFDHLRDKVADVSVLAREGHALEKVKREIDKCEVVCANCHRRRTARQFGTYRYRLK
jgi:5-methylcytosine-specific restriction endonuclease McrA